MSNLTDLGLVEVVNTEFVNAWPIRVNGLLNALAAIRGYDQVRHAGPTAAMAVAGTAIAGTARATITFDRQVRVRWLVQATVDSKTATAGTYYVEAARNPGAFNFATRTISSERAWIDTAASRKKNAVALGEALLSAGQYTFYAAITRNAGADATDVATEMTVAVQVISLV